MPNSPLPPYPTVDTLVLRLTGAGVDAAKITALQTGGALSGALEQAIAEWEGAVGWNPYVAGLAPETRFFDPPTRTSGGGRVPGTKRLDLRAGLITLTSLTVAGTLYTQGQDFYLKAYRASGVQGTVYTDIDFLSPQYGLPQSIAVTGIWGRVSAVPLDVKNALITYALSLAAPDLGFAISEGLFEYKIGDVTRRYGGTNSFGPMSQQASAWQQAFGKLVKRDKRITL